MKTLLLFKMIKPERDRIYLENFPPAVQASITCKWLMTTQILCHVPSQGRTGIEWKPSKHKIHRIQISYTTQLSFCSHWVLSLPISCPAHRPATPLPGLMLAGHSGMAVTQAHAPPGSTTLSWAPEVFCRENCCTGNSSHQRGNYTVSMWRH